MTRLSIASGLASVLALGTLGCEPEAGEAPEPPGTLEYEHSHVRVYRLDRRVDVIQVQDDDERAECAVLSERAYTELEATLSVLDAKQDYGYDPETQACDTVPGAFVYVEGFEHSPFECAWYCCRPELVRAALIYSLVESGSEGSGAIVDGEPYVAIDPDASCQ